MKIAYVCADPGIAVLGHKGASVHLRSLATALHRRGHDVLLAASAIDGQNPPPAGIVIERLPPAGADAAAWLANRFREWRAEVVLERYSLSSGPGLTAARMLHLAFVLEVNAPLVEEAARYRGLTNIDQWRAREQELLRAADHVIAVSEGVREAALASGVPRERVVVIRNGVDVNLFASGRGKAIRRRYGLGDGPVVGFAGSLKPWHGVTSLVRTTADLPDAVQLLIVGDGPQRDAIEALAADLNVHARIRLAGAVPHERMPDYLAAMDIAVAPYEPQPDFYFSPLKVLEYMAAGLPVIASNQGDLPGIVADAGILVTPGDDHALRHALTLLLNDEQRRADLGLRARRRARAMSWDAVARQVEDVLRLDVVAA